MISAATRTGVWSRLGTTAAPLQRHAASRVQGACFAGPGFDATGEATVPADDAAAIIGQPGGHGSQADVRPGAAVATTGKASTVRMANSRAMSLADMDSH